MNNITLVGRLSSDVQSRKAGESTVATFPLAVQRDFAREGQQDTDFINIEVWGKTAENCVKYLEKGRQVAIVGSLRIEKYQKDGENKLSTKVRADKVKFLGTGKPAPQASEPEFEPVADFIEATATVIEAGLDGDDIPF